MNRGDARGRDVTSSLMKRGAAAAATWIVL